MRSAAFALVCAVILTSVCAAREPANSGITVTGRMFTSSAELAEDDASWRMDQKDSASIINCARGGIIDEDALYHALKDGKILSVELA